MGFCEFDGVGLLPYKGVAILAFITIKFDLLGMLSTDTQKKRKNATAKAKTEKVEKPRAPRKKRTAKGESK